MYRRMDDDEIRRCRYALRSRIGVLLEAHKRLVEAEAPVVVAHAVADAAPPSAGDDVAGQLAAGNPPVAATDDDDDSFYPLDEPEDDATQLDTRWAHRLFDDEVYDDIVGALQVQDTAEAAPGRHGSVVVQLSDSDPYDDDDDVSQAHIDQAILAGRLHVPRTIHDTPLVFDDVAGGGGFGGVPAAASAIARLKKHRYDGSGAGGDSSSSRCVICLRDYKKGKRLVAMPCEHAHRFHGKCLRKWLARSHLCPLCRHALPTED